MAQRIFCLVQQVIHSPKHLLDVKTWLHFENLTKWYFSDITETWNSYESFTKDNKNPIIQSFQTFSTKEARHAS